MRSPSKLLTLHPSSRYGVLNQHFQRMEEELSKLGLKGLDFSTAGYRSVDALQADVNSLLAAETSPVLVFTTAAFLLNKLNLDDRHTCLTWLVDHPAHFYTRFQGDNSAFVISANPAHAHFLTDFSNSTYLLDSIAGVSGVSDSTEVDAKFDYVAACSWMEEPDPFWEKIQETILVGIAKEGIEKIVNDDYADPYQIFKGLFEQHGIDYSSNGSALAGLSGEADLFIRRYSRVKVITEIIGSGRTLLLVGSGWKDRLGDQPNVTYVESHDFLRLRDIYRLGKYVVNMNAPSGASERVSLAAEIGRPAVSQRSHAMNKVLASGGALRCFSLQDKNLGDFFRELPIFYQEDLQYSMKDNGLNTWGDIASSVIESLRRI